MPLEVLLSSEQKNVLQALENSTWKRTYYYITPNFCIAERDTSWSLTTAGNKDYMIKKGARLSSLPTLWKQGHFSVLPFIPSYPISINKTPSQLLIFVFQREHYSVSHLSCVRNLQAAWKDFYRPSAYSCGYLHHSKQFSYSICDFVLAELGLCSHQFLAERFL